MAELISFAVPTQSDKVLLVWELSAGPPAEALSHSLAAVFSQFGLLYSIRVFPNAAVARPGFYAIIKFYSSRDAQKAQKACDGKPLFQTSPVKVWSYPLSRPAGLVDNTQLAKVISLLPEAGSSQVRLSTRHKALQHRTFALNSSRCQELANYYFGFNGWSKRIIRLQELPGPEDEALTGPVQKRSLKFFCAVEVVLPPYGCKSPGVGIAEEPLHQLEEEGQSSFLMKRKTAQKLAIQSALADAFQKLAIVVLESGKVAVEYRPGEESIDAEGEEDLQSLIQVNCLQPGQREEECLSDFSLEEDELNPIPVSLGNYTVCGGLKENGPQKEQPC